MSGYRRLAGLIALMLLTGGSRAMPGNSFHAVTLVDRDNPVPAEWLQKAGIDYVYTGAPLKMERGAGGEPVVPESHRAGWEGMAREYADAGVKVLIMSNYYSNNPPGTEAYDVGGRRLQMACLRSDQFYEWMREAIVEQARAYGEYGAFGGFVFDDGWGTRVDACYCDTCTTAFRERYGKEPPPFEVHEGTGIVADDDALLQWDEFQREGHLRYAREQSEAVRSVRDDLLMLTIPSDSYFYGRLLNANMQREETPPRANALMQRIERLQVKNWFIYQSFPLPRLPEAGEVGLQRWAVGHHITADSPKLILATQGPFIQHYARMQMMSPAEIEQMAKITITEGADSLCYWVSGAHSAYHPTGYDGMAAVHEDVQKVQEMLTAREPYAARLGLLYSTTTEIMEQPWKTNMNERWQHLHGFEGTAFALLRGNVWFRVVMENEIAEGALEELDVLVVPAVRFLSRSAHEALERAAGRLRVCTAGSCVGIAGAEAVDYDVMYWHRRIQAGYRQIKYLNAHYGEAEENLLPRVREHVQQPVTVSSPMGISKLYRVGDDLVLMAANWDLERPTEASVRVSDGCTVVDMLTGERVAEVPDGGNFAVEVPAVGWRILRLE